MRPEAIDLSDGRAFAAGFPHAYFTWLRDNEPVFWHEPTAVSPDGEGFWVVSRYEDVREVQTRPDVFSSETGGHRTRGGTGLSDERTGNLINFSDDPKHKMLRSLVNKGFTRAAIARLEDNLRARARRLIDAFPENTSFDFVAEFARELPLQAICMVLGVPQEDRTQLCDWIDLGLAAETPEILAPEYQHKISNYGRALIAEKRSNPQDDILSGVVHARLDGPDGRALTDAELLGFFQLLFPAGAETTRSAIGGGLKALMEHPDQLDIVRHDPKALPSAIEEIVRWTTPSIYKRRTATQDVEFKGHNIKAGDKVTFWEMSANRDERIFAEPFKFDVRRMPNPHLGFGYGVHVCLGSMLARLELRIALEELLTRIDDFRSAGDVEWMPNNRLLGIRHFPMTVSKSKRAA
jgi:cytochrome P450